MIIGRHDTDARVLIVAEIGNNHEGSVSRAHEMVRSAAASGADAVKFQTYRTEHLVGRGDPARFARLQSFELTPDQFAELGAAARDHGLLFLSTPFDEASVSTLEPLVDAYKVASGDVTFVPLLEAVGRTQKPVVLSSGASTLAEVVRAAAVIRAEWPVGSPAELAVLHCVSSYPTPAEEAHLSSIAILGTACRATPGYSDHVLGIEAAVAAVAAGARIVEKHFTLDKQYSDFRDHQLSADPADMRELVGRIRALESMLGTGEKRVQPSEAANRDAIRRSVVMAVDRGVGDIVAAADLRWVRPAGGLAPGEERLLLGRRLRRTLRAGERLAAEDLE